MTFDEFCNDPVIKEFKDNKTLRIQVVEKKQESRRTLSEQLLIRLEKDIPSNYRIAPLDLSDFKDFESFFNFLVNATYDALKFSPIDLPILRDELLDESDTSKKRDSFQRFIDRIVKKKNIRLVFVFINFEKAATYWQNPDDISYMRSLLGDYHRHMSVILFSELLVSEVIVEPVSSSTFSDIFCRYPFFIDHEERETEDVVKDEDSDLEKQEIKDFSSGRNDCWSENVVEDAHLVLEKKEVEDNTNGDIEPIFENVTDTENSFVEEEEKRDFIGRKEELKNLDNLAFADSPVHCSLFGLPRIGKTWLIDEWIGQVKNNKKKTLKGRELYILSCGSLNGYSNYTAVINKFLELINDDFPRLKHCFHRVRTHCLLRNYSKCKNIHKLRRRVAIGTNVSANATENPTERLRSAIEKVNSKYSRRVVLLIDEFELVGKIWKEEEYRQFCSLLLDKKLDLFCIVVSRPHISKVVGKYNYEIIPFKPYLLHSFSDVDMTEYLGQLESLNILVKGTSDYEKNLELLFYACGKVPTLLHDTTFFFRIRKAQDTIDGMFAQVRTNVRRYYRRVAKFLLEEERDQQRSFTHVIKCYFGASVDYEDIIRRYIDLGYVEKIETSSEYAKYCQQYVCFDENGTPDYHYTTVSPGFIDYLHFGNIELTDRKTRRKETVVILDEIKDVRDLFTGLIHALRRITEEELKKHLEESLTLDPNIKYEWYELLLNCFYAKDGETFKYAVRKSRNSNDWGECWKKIDDKDWRDKERWIEDNGGMMIQVSSSSLTFAIDSLRKGGKGVELLDSISLLDHAEILFRFSNLFAPYFGVVGDLVNDSDSMKLLTNSLAYLHYNVRNPLSHYCRRKQSRNVMEPHRRLCVELLKSIYGYIANDECVAPHPRDIEEILDSIKRESTSIQNLEEETDSDLSELSDDWGDRRTKKFIKKDREARNGKKRYRR